MKYRFIIIPAAAYLLNGCAQPPAPTTADLAPGSPTTLNVADAAIAGGDPAMALSVSQSVLTSDPNNSDALVHEGDAYYALGRCPASEAAYSLALKNDPKSSQAETGLGRCLIKTDPRSAELALVAAVQDDPGNAAAYNDLGIARDLQGNFSGAIDPYRKALVAQPGMTAAEINLGLSLALSGDGQEALQYLGPLATGQSATPKIREDYAAALVSTGQIAQARHVLSIDLAPDDVDHAIDGFSAIIAKVQPPLADNTPPPPATVTQIETTTVTATPLNVAPVVAPAQAAPAVPIIPTPPVSAPAASVSPGNAPASSDGSNPNAAYSGPSPIPGAVSSSTGAGPATPSAATTAMAATPSMHSAPTPAPITPAASASATDNSASAATASADAGSASASGNYQVQLGALPSQDEAQRTWDRLANANPSLFSDKTADIETADVKGKTYYRLRTGSFASKADAGRFCGEVSAAGHVCTLANF